MRISSGMMIRVLSVMGIYLLYSSMPQVQDFCQNVLTILKDADIEEMKNFLLSYGFWMPMISITIMTLQSVFPFVPGMIITLANSWLFGWQLGAIYSWIGALIGAIVDFLLARFYGKFLVDKLIPERYITIFNRYIRENGMIGVLAARIIPIVPFKVISYTCGLSKMPLENFILITGLGQIPGILVYSFIGNHIVQYPMMSAIITLILMVMGFTLYLQKKRLSKLAICKWLKSF